jgi:Cu/Ag efflux pump CusA
MNERRTLDIYVANLDCETEANAITRGLSDTPHKQQVALSQVADVQVETGPAQSSREDVQHESALRRTFEGGISAAS